MAAKTGMIRNVIPALPGFVVLHSHADMTEVSAAFDADHFVKSDVIAWCVDVWVHPEDDFRVMSVMNPLTIEGNVEGCFAIIDPAGAITRPFHQSYPSVHDAMADMWCEMLRKHEHDCRYPFLSEPKARAA